MQTPGARAVVAAAIGHQSHLMAAMKEGWQHLIQRANHRQPPPRVCDVATRKQEREQSQCFQARQLEVVHFVRAKHHTMLELGVATF